MILSLFHFVLSMIHILFYVLVFGPHGSNLAILWWQGLCVKATAVTLFTFREWIPWVKTRDLGRKQTKRENVWKCNAWGTFETWFEPNWNMLKTFKDRFFQLFLSFSRFFSRTLQNKPKQISWFWWSLRLLSKPAPTIARVAIGTQGSKNKVTHVIFFPMPICGG